MMSRRTAVIGIAGASLVLIVILVAWGRLGNNAHNGAAHLGGHTHEDSREHHHTEATDTLGPHSEDGDGLARAGGLSGTVVGGVRVVRITTRKFEFDPNTVVVRQGENVRLLVVTADVTHGISISGYDISRRVEPGTAARIEFLADRPGRHHFHCSVYCGSGHGDMHGELIVLASSE